MVDSEPQRVRRKVACKLCNARRVRCDATPQTSCSRCRTAGEICEMGESRRRKRNKSRPEDPPRAATRIRRQSDHEAIPSAPLPANPQGASPTSSLSRPSSHSPGREGSEMLWSSLVDAQESPPGDPPVGNRIVYLVEPFNLAYVVHEASEEAVGSRTSMKMHYPVSNALQETAHNIPYDAHDAKFQQKERELLEWKGAFTVPEKPIHERLLKTYFQIFHPNHPIFDRNDFFRRLEENRLSYLVLQAVYFLAATHCDMGLISDAGFSSRQEARLTFYKRARALYDADYESDAVATVQALFLISFWWGGALDQKDTWHWLGAAIGLAQSKGMHRSTKGSDLSAADQRLWKRIWWSIYIRDRHASCSLGRPMRIQDDDCDVEMLEESDFEDDKDNERANDITTKELALYVIQMTKLTVILGKILKNGFPLKENNDAELMRTSLMDEVSVWKSQLPYEMQYQGIGTGTGVRFWSSMLHIAYNNYIILLYRPVYAKSKSPQGSNVEDMLLIAANRITRTIDDLLSERRARCAPLHVIAGVFAALSIHIMSIRRSSDEVSKKLADHRAQMCMLGLSEMQEPWPCGGWILRVFVRIMEKVKNRGTANTAKTISQKTADSAVDVLNSNMESSVEIQNQAGQEVPMVIDSALGGDSEIGSGEMGLEGQIDSGQFSIDDGSFMLNMVNEAEYFFPGGLGQDFSSQIPYFRDLSMLGI